MSKIDVPDYVWNKNAQTKHEQTLRGYNLDTAALETLAKQRIISSPKKRNETLTAETFSEMPSYISAIQLKTLPFPPSIPSLAMQQPPPWLCKSGRNIWKLRDCQHPIPSLTVRSNDSQWGGGWWVGEGGLEDCGLGLVGSPESS